MSDRSVLNRIAYFQNRRDEVPNQELARDLADRGDREGIQLDRRAPELTSSQATRVNRVIKAVGEHTCT